MHSKVKLLWSGAAAKASANSANELCIADPKPHELPMTRMK
jgi:hypothetical protein